MNGKKQMPKKDLIKINDSYEFTYEQITGFINHLGFKKYNDLPDIRKIALNYLNKKPSNSLIEKYFDKTKNQLIYFNIIDNETYSDIEDKAKQEMKQCVLKNFKIESKNTQGVLTENIKEDINNKNNKIINKNINKNRESNLSNNKTEYLKQIKEKYKNFKKEIKNNYIQEKKDFLKENLENIKIKKDEELTKIDNDLKKEMKSNLENYRSQLLINEMDNNLYTISNSEMNEKMNEKKKLELDIKRKKTKINNLKEINLKKKRIKNINYKNNYMQKNYNEKNSLDYKFKEKMDNLEKKLKVEYDYEIEELKKEWNKQFFDSGYENNENNYEHIQYQYAQYSKELDKKNEIEEKIIKINFEKKMIKDLEEYKNNCKDEIEEEINKIKESKQKLNENNYRNLEIVKNPFNIEMEKLENFYKNNLLNYSEFPKYFQMKFNKIAYKEIQDIIKAIDVIFRNYYYNKNISIENNIEEAIIETINKIKLCLDNYISLIKYNEKGYLNLALNIQYYAKILLYITKKLKENSSYIKIILDDENENNIKEDSIINEIIFNIDLINAEFKSNSDSYRIINNDLFILINNQLENQSYFFFKNEENNNKKDIYSYSVNVINTENSIFRNDFIPKCIATKKFGNFSINNDFNYTDELNFLNKKNNNHQRANSQRKFKKYNLSRCESNNLPEESIKNILYQSGENSIKSNSTIFDTNNIFPTLPNEILNKFPKELFNKYQKIVQFISSESLNCQNEVDKYNNKKKADKILNEIIDNLGKDYDILNKIGALEKDVSNQNKKKIGLKLKYFNNIKLKCQEVFDFICLNNNYRDYDNIEDFFDNLLDSTKNYNMEDYYKIQNKEISSNLNLEFFNKIPNGNDFMGNNRYNNLENSRQPFNNYLKYNYGNNLHNQTNKSFKSKDFFFGKQFE